MEPRRIAVFFYGLFMDATQLSAKGVSPVNIRRASLPDFALRIGQRATLVPESKNRVHGLLMDLTHEEIDRLYAEPSVSMYRPEAVLCELQDGSTAPALCFNLPLEPASGESNTQYAEKLRSLARRLQLPDDYVERIG